MTTDLNFEVSGTTVYALEFDSWRKGVEQMRNRVYTNVQGYRDTPKEEVEAVAKLFSAAPEMLKALKMAQDALKQWQDVVPEYITDIDHEANKAIKEAIEKATK